jgi:hypothetical protein
MEISIALIIKKLAENNDKIGLIILTEWHIDWAYHTRIIERGQKTTYRKPARFFPNLKLMAVEPTGAPSIQNLQWK